jgi:membrane-bound lytic murein transglycosylase MltF
MENYFSFYNRFFACYNPYRKGRDKRILTPYDDLLKEYSKSIGWDWKLLASLMWNESRFKISVKSKRGAQGLMQVMPASAAKFGITDLLDPEENIKCSVLILSRLQDILKGYGIEGSELTKYTLAAYNAGSGNITDAISTARNKKVDVSRWSNFAAYFTGERNDALRFEGLETIAYVRVVLGRYDIFRGVVPQNSAQEKEIELEERQVEQMIDSLGSDSLGGVDPGNEETRDKEQEQDNKIRDSVGKENSR